ncbi:MAG: ROK family protein [Erysipelotrichaceae bacterium]|nr:ROK family protein [Erysipelotrichaceae bacterium]
MYLGIDMGGTFIKYALIDNDGTITNEKGKIPTITDDKDACLKSMQELYFKYKDRGINGIAMSVPGLIDVYNGIMITSGAISCLKGCHMAEELSALCDGVKVSVENDGKAAALAEAWIGAAKDVQNCYVLGFGTGIAGAGIINKRAFRGPNLIAGEMSLFPLRRNAEEGGMDYLANQYSTNTAVRNCAQALGVETDKFDGEKMMKMYREGNETVVKCVEDWFYNIAVVCYQLSIVFDPEMICIGGGISADPLFVEGIQKHVHKLAETSFVFLEPKVVPCEFRNDSNLIGALYNFKQLYE